MTTTTILIGNLTREPEIRYTRDGQARATFAVAVNRPGQNRDTNHGQETTSFFDVVCWRDLAENAVLSLGSGSRIMVVGRLQQRSWEQEGGTPCSKVEVVADDLGPSLRFATAEVQPNERRGVDAPSDTAGAGHASESARVRR